MHFLQGLFNYKFHRSLVRQIFSRYFLFSRSSREVPRRELPRRIYGKSDNRRPTCSTLLYILLARLPLCIQRRFFRSCSSSADSRLLSLITTVAYLTRASWDALEIGSGRMIRFIYSANGTSEILLGSGSNPLLRISRRVTRSCVIYRVFRRRWQNTIQRVEFDKADRFAETRICTSSLLFRFIKTKLTIRECIREKATDCTGNVVSTRVNYFLLLKRLKRARKCLHTFVSRCLSVCTFNGTRCMRSEEARNAILRHLKSVEV